MYRCFSAICNVYLNLKNHIKPVNKSLIFLFVIIVISGPISLKLILKRLSMSLLLLTLLTDPNSSLLTFQTPLSISLRLYKIILLVFYMM